MRIVEENEQEQGHDEYRKSTFFIFHAWNHASFAVVKS